MQNNIDETLRVGMAAPIGRTLRNLRNTRDLRAEILSLAAELAGTAQAQGQMVVVEPVITAATVRKEWNGLLPAIAPEIRDRMVLAIEGAAADRPGRSGETTILALDKPNYRFEVLRLLVGASLEGDGPQPEAGIAAQIENTQIGLAAALGTSVTPVRNALTVLCDAHLIPNLRWLEVEPESLSMEQLSRIGALPQTLRFRFERGARIKPPAELLKRAEPLLGTQGPEPWNFFSLSGTPVAQKDTPGLDLVGVPRLDLVAHAPRGNKAFDTDVMRVLDDGLELEPNVLAPAPVVVTLVRAGTRFDRDTTDLNRVRCAHPCDVFLSLLDMGLREQALHYAKAVRP